MNENQRQLDFEDEENRRKKQEENAKKSPFNNFIQVNKECYKAEDWLMSKSPMAYRIFRFLINNMDSYNAVICSYRVLEEHFDISQVTVSRSIKLLKEKGYLAVFKSGTSNVYTINDKIVWSSWGKNYQYSRFPANVVLSISEQEKNIQLKNIRHKEVVIKEV